MKKVELLKVLLMADFKTREGSPEVRRGADGPKTVFEKKDCDRSCDEPGSSNGLCAKHRVALRNELVNRPLEEQIAIRSKYEKAGTLLRNQEIREYEKLSAEAG